MVYHYYQNLVELGLGQNAHLIFKVWNRFENSNNLFLIAKFYRQASISFLVVR